MNILIVLSSQDPEIKWNALRLGNFMLNEGDEVTFSSTARQLACWTATRRPSP